MVTTFTDFYKDEIIQINKKEEDAMINSDFDGVSNVLKVGIIAAIAYYVAGPVGLAVVALMFLLKKK